MAKKSGLSIYLSFLLRHKPEELNLHMDKQGWVNVNELIDAVNTSGRYMLDYKRLKDLVDTDEKKRYRLSEDGNRIKACQGHSIPWVEVELVYTEPPARLYHGTTVEAYKKILASEYISKMERHAVHMQEDVKMAWKSAKRWKKNPVVLGIDAETMYKEGYVFGRSENDVWCVEEVPVQYIVETIYS